MGRAKCLQLALCLALSLPASTAASTIIGDTVRLPGNGSSGPYWLSGFFVLGGTESVRVAEQFLRRDTDYAVDYNTGSIRFSCPLLPGDSAIVCFQRLRFALPSRWTIAGRRRPDTTASPPEAQNAGLVPVSYTQSPAPPPMAWLPGRGHRDGVQDDIRWEGSKSLTFTAADRGERSWSQGLELSVQGDLAPGVQLSAAVSDRAVAGLNGERTSADGLRLGTLDRLFIEARSSRFYGRWGELTLTDPPAGTAPRRATGMQMRWAEQAHVISGMVARPHGDWKRRRIPLLPDVSGPYRLAEIPTGTGIVPGSVTVWLDGDRLEEGDGRDYSVDWARGTVTLSPGRRVSGQSILVVEFEQALDAYARTLAGSQWSWVNARGDRRQALSFQWEGDDPSTPLSGGGLTDAQRDQLAHDPSGRVRTSTGEHVAADQGDYRLDTLGNGDSVFVYVGPGRGDWRARFQWVGTGRGRYRHLADEAYEYVGMGSGDYEASVTLSAPTSRLDVSESMTLSLGTTGRLTADWRGMAIDRNRLASGATTLLSDHRLGVLLGRTDADGSGGLNVEWRRHAGNGGLRRAGEGGELARFADVWGLRASLADSAFDEYDLATAVPLGRGDTVHASGGYWRGAHSTAWRRLVDLRFIPWRGLRSDLRWDRRDAHGSRNLLSGRRESYLSTLQCTPRWGTVGIGWQQSECNDTTGVFEPSSRHAAARWTMVSVRGVAVRHSWETARDSSIGDIRRTRELSVSCPVTVLGGVGSGELVAARGARAWGSGTYVPFYRGRLSGRWEPTRSADLRIDMALSQQQAGAQRERFLPTRPGEGQFRYERGEYIPDPHGDFRRVLVDDSGDQTAAYQGDKRFTLSWWPVWGGWRWSFSLEREVHGRYRSNTFGPGEWIVPWTSVASSLLPGAQLVIRDAHKLSARPSERTQISATVGRERTVFSSQTPTAEDAVSDSRRVEARVRRELAMGFYIETAAEYQRRERRGLTTTALNADGRTLLLVIGGDSRRGLGAAVESRRRIDREFHNGDQVLLWGIAPRAQARIAAVTVSLRTDLTWVGTDIAAYSLSPLMVDGRPRGFSATESAELRWQLPGRVTFNLRMYGDHRADEPDRWRVDVESVVRL